MKNLSYGVIGLGKFGSVVANELLLQGKSVVIADKDEEVLKKLQDLASHTYILDSTNITALKEAGFSSINMVIVSIGANIENSILTLMALKDIGVKNIIAKASTPIHGQILSKLGATKVIYPEKESAKRLVKEFLIHPEFEIFDLSANTLRVVKIAITQKQNAQTIKSIAKNMKTLAYKKEGKEWEIFPDENLDVFVGDNVILFGGIQEFAKFIDEI
ncbi:Trk system potassium uptake protein TrkA [Campylobacter sputorum subsp. bubulus]|uniref:Trk system potassium uptake protein TrkA n=1 Tax=Campylobacter sputorum subsp. sputorum TaxID=32024 RepID=A0A381DL44_9BACT|nr:TrkA family potassium uptake protein [Campylobacter sputorum]ASM34610.1 potassium transporter KtrAB, KtrA subunit [Campylobacter sputorum aubsp. sputorum RM3237]ASM36274.1 potassium transporter KtrAB, KtrA subunit [Campylobacter sputorum bv. faecalis CCUG 20703]ASM37954.1 potassium transporter KtrAB, KtrA subunit [Campylobacter sputorum bv. paraureolyticus LMG 11764]KAB0581174.1 TrkA family potassium uptake protein [Campylobacter sputorum subsp. sputorum]MDY6121076.1 TrkA family potassium u